jgi:YfiH family protein
MGENDAFKLATLGPWSNFHVPALERAGIVHGFMTRSSDSILSEGAEEREFAHALGAAALVSLRQEHGDVVHVIENGERPHAGDGLIVLERGVCAIIKTADCLPVIIYSRDGGVAAIVHAGWRGSAAHIVGKAVRQLSAIGFAAESLGVLLGPGIGPCCYNVGEDVVSAFRRAGFGEGIFEQRGSSTFLDLKAANREAAEGQGVADVLDVGLCTACRGDLFFSARREKTQGRQINFVLLKGA